MKKITLISIVALLAISFTSCKKGENDPFLSFKSRKARVSGDWKVTSIIQTVVFTNSGDPSLNTSTDYTMTNTSYTNAYTTTAGTITTSGTQTWEWFFKADADARFESTNTVDGAITSSGGKWNFSAGLGKLKNKSQILLYTTSYSSPGYSYNSEGTNEVSTAYDLKELRSKKMVWVYSNTQNSGSGTTKTDIEMVLEPK